MLLGSDAIQTATLHARPAQLTFLAWEGVATLGACCRSRLYHGRYARKFSLFLKNAQLCMTSFVFVRAAKTLRC